LAKLKDKHYAVASFCGFDFTNLGQGVLIGEKLICPTCGSTYNIKTGKVEQGPALRGLSSFLVQVRDEEVRVVTPEHIPAF